MTAAGQPREVTLYRTRLTDVEYRTDALLPEALTIEAILPENGVPFIRVGDRDLDYHEAMALADVLAAAAAVISPDAFEYCAQFPRPLQPRELSPPTPAQQALACHRADQAAMLVGMVTSAMAAELFTADTGSAGPPDEPSTAKDSQQSRIEAAARFLGHVRDFFGNLHMDTPADQALHDRQLDLIERFHLALLSDGSLPEAGKAGHR